MNSNNNNTPNRFGHNVFGYPEAAFSDPSGDKPTQKIIEYDIYEGWRDTIAFTALGMAVLGGAWLLVVGGSFQTYATILWLYKLTNFGFFIAALSAWLKKWKLSDIVRNRLTVASIAFILVLFLHNTIGV